MHICCLEVLSVTGSNEGCSYDGQSQTPCGGDVAAQHVCLSLEDGCVKDWALESMDQIVRACGGGLPERTGGRRIHVLKVRLLRLLLRRVHATDDFHREGTGGSVDEGQALSSAVTKRSSCNFVMT